MNTIYSLTAVYLFISWVFGIFYVYFSNKNNFTAVFKQWKFIVFGIPAFLVLFIPCFIFSYIFIIYLELVDLNKKD